MKLLPAKPNRSIIYYKITNKNEIHYGLRYHNGLVIDPWEFDSNPKHTCIKGGIYFTTKEYLHRFFRYGPWIRPVTIPKDAQVVLDPEGDKYRSNRLFFHPRKSMAFYFAELFNKKTFLGEDYYHLAGNCSKYFDEWFDKKTFPKVFYWHLVNYCSKQLKERKIDKVIKREVNERNKYINCYNLKGK